MHGSMADWSPSVCAMLMQMAKRSLVRGGKLIINEVSNFMCFACSSLYGISFQCGALSSYVKLSMSNNTIAMFSVTLFSMHD